MEQRLLLVLALTFVVVVLFQPLLKKYLPQAPTPPAQIQPPAPTPSRRPQARGCTLRGRADRSNLGGQQASLGRT